MTPEEWIMAAGAKADRTVQQAMRASDEDRNLQLRQLMWQVMCHGPAVAFLTPNLDTTANPTLACLAI
eukprot:gene49470-20636_t